MKRECEDAAWCAVVPRTCGSPLSSGPQVQLRQIVQRLTALQLAGSYGICGRMPFLDVVRKSIVDRMTLEQFRAVFPDDGDDHE